MNNTAIYSQISSDNDARFSAAQSTVGILYAFLGLTCIFINSLAVGMSSYIIPWHRAVPKRIRGSWWRVLLFWTLIYSAVVAIVTSAGIIGWLAMEFLSILTIFVVFIIYVIVRITDCIGDKDFSDPYYAEDADSPDELCRIPQTMSKQQTCWYLVSFAGITAAIVVFGGVFASWKVSDYQVFDREEGVAVYELKVKGNAQQLLMFYAFPNFAVDMRTGPVFQIYTDTCASAADKILTDSEKKSVILDNFINVYQINMSIYEKENYLDYSTLNDFFIREIKNGTRPVEDDNDPHIVVSPADCRITVFYEVPKQAEFYVKGEALTMQKLLQNSEYADYFDGGAMAIARLAPQDYHRFHAPINGTIIDIYNISGPLQSVNHDAIRSINPLYNKRTVAIIESEGFGNVAFIPVGSVCIGSIVFEVEKGEPFVKGQELGYFQYGGSTVVMLFQNGTINWWEDLQFATVKSVETLVKANTKIAEKIFV